LDSGSELEPSGYEAAIDFLYSRINYERTGHASYSSDNYRLDRMRRLLELLGNPHLQYPVIHIAGTKGKGTTAMATTRLLQSCGFKVGTYTSPHLLRIEERIRFQSGPCSPTEFIGLVGRIREHAEIIEAEGAGRPTFFEMTTAMGFLHFADKQCDAVVLEVGLGGRLDSTNVCQPTLCIITSISLDHQAQLGNTIGEIAGEKAGIIKPHVPVVCTARSAEARNVICNRADSLSSPIFLINRDFSVEWSSHSLSFDVEERDWPRKVATVHYHTSIPQSWIQSSSWDIGLLGEHQADNIGAALTAFGLFANCGHRPLTPSGHAVPGSIAAFSQRITSTSLSRLQNDLAQLSIPARMQIVGNNPIRLIDTAHNPASISATLDALDTHFPNSNKTIVFATSRDKDYLAMLKLILARVKKLIITAYHNNPRGLPLEELRDACEKTLQELKATTTVRCDVHSTESSAEAWQAALADSQPADIICATGSFFLAAELL
jgi:dihydrofolate synthase / folylpolyglutamate synthase